MTLTFRSWCRTLLFWLWTMGILSCPLFQNCYWSSKKEHSTAGEFSFTGARGPLCWGRRLVQVAWCAAAVRAAGRALGDGSPEKSPWTAVPLHNKGLGDLWLSQVRDTQRTQQEPRPPDSWALRLWWYKSPGFALSRVPPWRHPVRAVILLFHHNDILLRIEMFQSVAGNLGSRWWGNLVWPCECGMCSYEGALVPA